MSYTIKVNTNTNEPMTETLKKFHRAVRQSDMMYQLRYRHRWETAAEKQKRKKQHFIDVRRNFMKQKRYFEAKFNSKPTTISYDT